VTDSDPNKRLMERALFLAEWDFLERGNRISLANAVIASHEIGEPLPEWAHAVLSEVFIRYIKSEGDLDLNQLIGASQGERRPSRLKVVNQKFDNSYLAIQIGDALEENAALGPRRRKSKGAVWDKLAIDTGRNVNTIRRLWSQHLRRDYEIMKSDPLLLSILSSRRDK